MLLVFLIIICYKSISIALQTNPQQRLALPFHNWIGSVFFLFVEITTPTDWNVYTAEQLKAELVNRKLSGSGGRATLIERLQDKIAAGGPGILEISGSAFSITSRRFITCHHNIYNENNSMTINSVAICSKIVKVGNRMIPHPAQPVLYGDLHISNASLDYAIFNLRATYSDLIPIPICPAHALAASGSSDLICYYGAIEDFTISELKYLAIWRSQSFSAIIKYGESAATDPSKYKLWTRHGLCRGSSGGAIVMSNGQVVAMHLASVIQGGYVWKHVKGSSLTTKDTKEVLSVIQEIHCACKEGLVLCQIPQIMDAVGNP